MTERIPLQRYPNVFFGRYQVWNLSPTDIDELLANGWFRNEQHVQTTLGRFVENLWKPCLMIRIPMKGFVWKKRLKKRLRQNTELFEVKIRPYEPSKETEELWQDFKAKIHKWKTVPNLAYHILRANPPSSFNTYEITVYNGSDLIAFSLFDKGQKSMASLEAAYDIEYHNYSLGIFTMLVELKYCIENGMDYYYPGFFPKGTSMFDYKLRPGNVEFFRAKTGQWTPWEECFQEDWLLEGVLEKLNLISQKLTHIGFKCAVKVFNKIGFPTSYPSVSNYNFLTVGERQFDNHKVILVQVAFDPLLGKFVLFKKEMECPITGDAVQEQNFKPFTLVGSYPDLEGFIQGVKEVLAECNAPIME